MATEPTPDARVISAYLDDVAEELEAVRRLASPPSSRLASFHLQQAAEKLIKAARLHSGLPASVEHNLERLIHELPAGNAWPSRLRPLEWLSAFATTYRYPTPAGKRNPGPAVEKLLATASEIDALLVAARSEMTKKPTG